MRFILSIITQLLNEFISIWKEAQLTDRILLILFFLFIFMIGPWLDSLE